MEHLEVITAMKRCDTEMEKENLVQIVRSAQAGNTDAVSGLFDAYKNTVYAIAMRVLKNPTIAEDIVQETFITVFLKINDLEKPEAFPAWLNAVTYSKCNDYLKKKENTHENLAVIAEDGFSIFDDIQETNVAFIPDEALDHEEFKQTIMSMIDELPGVQRTALLMFYFEEMPIKDIAAVQGVSTNTANTRLNRGRLSIKKAIEKYENKHGVRLHSVAFLPLFKWLFDGTEQSLSAEATARIIKDVSTGIGIPTTTVGATSIISGTSATAVGTKVITTSLLTKVIAGVTAVSLAVGGVSLYRAKSNSNEDIVVTTESYSQQTGMEIPTETENSEELTAPLVEDSAQAAYVAYEKLLAEGKTISGLSIRYYAYLDMDQDGIPEMIVADNEGTPETLTCCEVYTYANDFAYTIGFTSAYYDYLYYVNDKYVRGLGRAGAEFVSAEECISTAANYMDEMGTLSGPVVSHNGGDWESISQEEYKYYNDLSGGFVCSSETITLQKNEYRQIRTLDQVLDYSKAWSHQEDSAYGTYTTIYTFDERGKFYCLFGFDQAEVLSSYCGTYTFDEDVLTLAYHNDYEDFTCAYRLDESSLTLTQLTDKGVSDSQIKGGIFQLHEDAWNSPDRVIELFGIISQDYSFFEQSQYLSLPYYNKATEQVGTVGVDLDNTDSVATLMYFGCWVDGVAPSVEDFIFEYQEEIDTYTLSGNRNRSAEYELTVSITDEYIDVVVKCNMDEYKIIPEGNYRFYRNNAG